MAAYAGMYVQAALAKDVKTELEATLATLSGKGKGTGKGKPPRGLERKKMWDDVKALRKEWVLNSIILLSEYLLLNILVLGRYRQREGGVVRSVLAESQVRDTYLAWPCHT